MFPRSATNGLIINSGVDKVGSTNRNGQSILDKVGSVVLVGLLKWDRSISGVVNDGGLDVHAADMEVGTTLVAGLDQEVEVLDEGVRVVSASFDANGPGHILDVDIVQGNVD